jgi:hypothetical protein
MRETVEKIKARPVMDGTTERSKKTPLILKGYFIKKRWRQKNQ